VATRPVANPPLVGELRRREGWRVYKTIVRVFVWFGRCEDCEIVVLLFGRQFQELLFGCRVGFM
jgi:hypothetical protein